MFQQSAYRYLCFWWPGPENPGVSRFAKPLLISLSALTVIFCLLAGAEAARADYVPPNEPGTEVGQGQAQQNRPASFEAFRNERTVAENLPIRSEVGEPIAASDPDGDSLYFSLTNGDTDIFSIDSGTGQVRTKTTLDYETGPEDDYWLHVSVRDSKGPDGGSDLVADDVGLIVIQVANADDPGTLTLNWQRPEVRAELEATLTDPDGATSSQTWQWARADSRTGTYTDINGQTQATYTPTATDDENKYLKITVSYTDPQGSGKSAKFEFTSPVRTAPLEGADNAPVFPTNTPTTYSVVENTPAGTNIGSPIRATNTDNQELRYSLTDPHFSIDPGTGQLRTKGALDHETKSSYTVTVKATDPGDHSATITVTINVTDVPVEITGPSQVNFSEGDYVYSRVVAVYDIFPASAELTLTGPDARHFSITAHAGLIFEEQPDYEAPRDSGRNNIYNVTINGVKSVAVRVTDYNEGPQITGGPDHVTYVEHTTGPVGRYTARDPENDPIRWEIQDTDDWIYFQISRSGVLSFNEPPDFEKPGVSDNIYEVVILAQSGMNQATDGERINVTVINAENDPPVFTESYPRTRSIDENTEAGQNIGTPVTATSVRQGASISYSLGGTHAGYFAIDSSTGQLRTKAALDYERRNSYTLKVRAADGGRTAVGVVTINVTNMDEPGTVVFSPSRPAARLPFVASLSDPDGGVTGKSWTWEVSADGTTNWQFISAATSATYNPVDGDVGKYLRATVTYTDTFGSGNTVSAKAGPVLTGQQRSPQFSTSNSQGTRNLQTPENSPSNQPIGAPVTATDADYDTLTYSLGGRDGSSFTIDRTTGQVKTRAALDYERKNRYTATVVASDGRRTSSTVVNIQVLNVEEAGTVTLSATQPTARVVLTATLRDPDGSVTNQVWQWYRSGSQSSGYTFISGATSATYTPADGDVGQYLRASVTYTDGYGPNRVAQASTTGPVRFGSNRRPAFPDVGARTFQAAENSPPGQSIGTPVTASDPDGNALTYTLGGGDGAAFAIDGTSGQLRTKAPLDFERKNRYTVQVRASDGSLTSETPVTINITNVDEVGAVSLSPSQPRVGARLTATVKDPDGSVSGQAWEWDVSDNGSTDWTRISGATAATYTPAAADLGKYLRVIVTYTDLFGPGNTAMAEGGPVRPPNALPRFTSNDVTRSVAENTPAGRNIGAPVSARDADGDTLTYSLGGSDAASFAITRSTGQLQTKAPLDYERKNSYSLTVAVSDGRNAGGGVDRATDASIAVTVQVTDLLEPPGRPRPPTLRAVAGPGLSISWVAPGNTGPPITGYDVDYGSRGDGQSNYTRRSVGGSASSISVSGLSWETVYEARVRAKNADGLGEWSALSSLLLSQIVPQATPQAVTQATPQPTPGASGSRGGAGGGQARAASSNRPPAFREGDGARRQTEEGTTSGATIGAPISAVDPDRDPLFYWISGFSPALFTMDRYSGQLRVKTTLPNNLLSSYAGMAHVSDGKGGMDTIKLTVAIDDASAAPVGALPLVTTYQTGQAPQPPTSASSSTPGLEPTPPPMVIPLAVAPSPPVGGQMIGAVNPAGQLSPEDTGFLKSVLRWWWAPLLLVLLLSLALFLARWLANRQTEPEYKLPPPLITPIRRIAPLPVLMTPPESEEEEEPPQRNWP